MTLPFTLLQVRLLQLKRELQLAGIRSLFVLLAVGIFLYATLVILRTENGYYVPVALAIACVLIQLTRNDLKFVHAHIAHPKAEIFFEYFLFCLPVLFLAIIAGNLSAVFLILLMLLPVPFLQPVHHQRVRVKNISTLVSPDCFEIISGFRKHFFSLLFLYAFAVATVYFRIVPLLFLWLITATVSSFYEECESPAVLKEIQSHYRKFLSGKILHHCRIIFLPYLPVLILNFFFHPEDGLIILLFFIIQLILPSLAICIKYSGYVANARTSGSNMILSIAIVSGLVPFLLPIPLLMLIVFFQKAKINLKLLA